MTEETIRRRDAEPRIPLGQLETDNIFRFLIVWRVELMTTGPSQLPSFSTPAVQPFFAAGGQKNHLLISPLFASQGRKDCSTEARLERLTYSTSGFPA